MLQAPQFDGPSLDPFSLQQDGLAAPEVDVGRRKIVEALVIAPMIVALDEGCDLGFEIAGQEVVLQEETILQGLVPALDLSGNPIQRKAGSCSAIAAQPAVVPEENVMENSVFEARWILVPVFVLGILFVTAGVFLADPQVPRGIGTPLRALRSAPIVTPPNFQRSSGKGITFAVEELTGTRCEPLQGQMAQAPDTRALDFDSAAMGADASGL